MTALTSLFAGLSAPSPGERALPALPFPGFSSHRIAKDRDGHAVVLVHTREDANSRRLVPIRTENLFVVHSARYLVRNASGAEDEEVFTSLTCLDQDVAIVSYFLELMGNVLLTVGDDPQPSEIDFLVRTILDLFRALVVPSAKSIQGVWAELFIIAASLDKEVIARAWHGNSDDRYDFARGSDRLEVKSSIRRDRKHHFSLDQLSPPPGTRLLIASVCTERSSGRLTLDSVLHDACEGLTAEYAARVRQIAASSLGNGFGNALDVAFDRELAESSLRYFDHSAVPRPTVPPREVSQVRFVAELSAAPWVDDVAALGSFWSALPPAK